MKVDGLTAVFAISVAICLDAAAIAIYISSETAETAAVPADD